MPEPGTDAGEALRAQLKGDLHSHSDWSDGGDTIAAMAGKARDLGHEYLALTDHSPRLKIANGLSADRLREQLDVVARAQRRARAVPHPHRRRGRHPRRRRARPDTRSCSRASTSWSRACTRSCAWRPAPMTRRMVAAVASPHVDVLGHCTGRLLVGRGRPRVDVRRRRGHRGVPAVRHRARGQLPARAARPAASGSSPRRSRPACGSRSAPTRTRPSSSSGSPTAPTAPPRAA